MPLSSLAIVFMVALSGTLFGLILAGVNARRGYEHGLKVAFRLLTSAKNRAEAAVTIRRLLYPDTVPPARKPAWPEAERKVG